MRLRDRVAIVTGADSGIGQAIAEEFAREGADIAILWHSDRAGAEETASRVQAAGRQALLVQGDVGEEADVERLFRETEEGLGEPDILVNNAGIGQDGQEVADTPAEAFDRVLRTNLLGVAAVPRPSAAAPSCGAAARSAGMAGSSTSPRCTSASRAPNPPPTAPPRTGC